VKRILVVLKWMSEQLRTYRLSLVLIIILSAILSLCKVGLAFIIKLLIDAAVDGVLKNAVDACV
jgi:ABC-type bacteriocin/lantibiotic exporter with double-glycine peptidase domain